MANKELSKMHVVVTDTETGKVMVDETLRTVLVVMNDYDDNEDNEYVETVQFMNGKAFKLARMAVVATSIAEHPSGLKIAQTALDMRSALEEMEDDD